LDAAVTSFLEQQRLSFVHAWNNPAQFPVGIREAKLSVGRVPLGGFSWHWAPHTRSENAFIRHAGGYAMDEFWVKPTYRGYRSAFLGYLGRVHGLDPSTLKQLAVDHALSRAYARKQGLTHVRLALLDPRINSAYGQKIERRLAAQPGTRKTVVSMEWIAFMKVLLITPPADYADFVKRKGDIAQEFKNAGVDDSVNAIEHELVFFFDKFKLL
jgi:hypothetical protein